MNYTTNFSDRAIKFKDVNPGDVFYIYNICGKRLYFIKAIKNIGVENVFSISDNRLTDFRDDADVFLPESFELKINI